jgi:hypothetical protein
MGDNFAATADRMMLDARRLYETGAHRNACYLAGYVVECTLKSLLEQTIPKVPRIHDLGTLQDEVATLSLNANAVVAKYGDPSRLAPTMLDWVAPPKMGKKGVDYFCHWDPGHRYDGSRWNTAAVSADYLREAEKCHDILTGMFLDGLVALS